MLTENTRQKFAKAKKLLDDTFVRRPDLDFEDDGHGPFMAYRINRHSYITALFDIGDERVYLSHHFFCDDNGNQRLINDTDAKSWLELRGLCGVLLPEELTIGRLKSIMKCSEIVFKENSRTIRKSDGPYCCPYCKDGDIASLSRGDNFAEEGMGCAFQIDRSTEGEYYINVWSGLGGENFDVDSDVIHYCPMCGRKLGKENN
jgi:hypothetical protein